VVNETAVSQMSIVQAIWFTTRVNVGVRVPSMHIAFVALRIIQ
jgi:hypothetical protein